MTVLRRRIPEHLREPFARFEALVPALERARAEITAAVPGTRLPGRPLAEALLAFEEGLREVRAAMDGWRAAELEQAWRAADSGLDQALALAERLRTRAQDPEGFEDLIGVVGELLAPLEAFREAAEAFRAKARGRR